MLSSAHLFVDGMIETSADIAEGPLASQAAAADVEGGTDLFGRYVSVYQSNEFLFNELKSANQKLERTRAYLHSPGSNPILAQACLDQIRAKRSAVLTLLRANRRQARSLLSRRVANVA